GRPSLGDRLQQVPQEAHVESPPGQAGGPVVQLGRGQFLELGSLGHGVRLPRGRRPARWGGGQAQRGLVGAATTISPWPPTRSGFTGPASTSSRSTRWRDRATTPS